MKIKIGKGLFMMCNCLNKIVCICIKFLQTPSRNHHTQRDFDEWRRIEGIGYFHKKRP